MKEGMKFDEGKARWELVPTEYFVSLSQVIQSFIERHMLREKKITFNQEYIYNVVRANIFRWRLMGLNGPLGRAHPLMDATVGLLMLAKKKEYCYEDVFPEFSFVQRWDLIDAEWTTKLAEVYTYGAKLYEDNNWQQVESDRYYAALNRHIDKYAINKLFDEESGLHHLYHAAWNCIALMWFESHTPIPEPILKTARKLRGIDAIDVKIPTVKKKSVKKKVVKKKRKN